MVEQDLHYSHSRGVLAQYNRRHYPEVGSSTARYATRTTPRMYSQQLGRSWQLESERDVRLRRDTGHPARLQV